MQTASSRTSASVSTSATTSTSTRSKSSTRASKAPKLVKTSTPGVYRRGNRYVVVYRDPTGKQRKKFAKTLAEARAVKSALTADVQRGEYRELSKVPFVDYAKQWVNTYEGRTVRGIRPGTLRDYRRPPFLGLHRRDVRAPPR
jgi:hypothetical protein